MNSVVRTLVIRVTAAIVVMIGVSILIFTIARVIPGDPARIALGPLATEQQVEKMREARHLNEPLPVQYAIFVRDVFNGDLGRSFYTNRPVTTDIAQFLPASLELIFVAGVLMIVLGLPLGIVSAHFKGRAADQVGRLLALLSVCTPAFVWGVIFQLVFAYFWPIFPLEGQLAANAIPPPRVTGFMTIDAAVAGDWRLFVDALYHLVLPSLALAMAGIGQTARLTRANMVEAYERPFIEMGLRSDEC
jgi:peptide/nickel transport system permease protein